MKKIFLTIISLMLFSTASYADHAWSNYHWARDTTSFDLTIVNSTTADWDVYVGEAVTDWSASNELNMVQDASDNTKSRIRRQCNGPAGQVRICNLAYGQTGWLGIAGISIDSEGHITTGYTKLNDTYFASGYYNTAAWRQSVTCQELGHNVGLGHQDEDFGNMTLKSCMDYQDPPWPAPNTHDYGQLTTIYGHLDSYNSYVTGDSGGGGGGTCNSPPGKGCNKGVAPGAQGNIGWGVSLGRRGQGETFMRIDPDGTRHITHVTWAIGH